MYIQDDEVYFDVLQHASTEVAYKRTKIKSRMPVKVKRNVSSDNIEKVMGTSAPGDTPVLWLFFNDNKFDVATIAADTKILHLQASDIPMALLIFIGAFYVFQVGYNPQDSQFLGLLQRVFLAKEFKEPKSTAYPQFVDKFHKEYRNIRDKKQFKKLCT